MRVMRRGAFPAEQFPLPVAVEKQIQRKGGLGDVSGLGGNADDGSVERCHKPLDRSGSGVDGQPGATMYGTLI